MFQDKLPRVRNDSDCTRGVWHAPLKVAEQSPDTAPAPTFTAGEVLRMHALALEMMRTLSDDEIDEWVVMKRLELGLEDAAWEFLKGRM